MMTLSKNNILYLFIFLFLGACQVEPCDDVYCPSGFYCDDGQCLCVSSPENNTCDEETRKGFISTETSIYIGKETCYWKATRIDAITMESVIYDTMSVKDHVEIDVSLFAENPSTDTTSLPNCSCLIKSSFTKNIEAFTNDITWTIKNDNSFEIKNQKYDVGNNFIIGTGHLVKDENTRLNIDYVLSPQFSVSTICTFRGKIK